MRDSTATVSTALWAASLTFLAAVLWVAFTIEFTVAREVWLLSTTGYGALAALFASLAVTPISRLAAFLRHPWPPKVTTPLRRCLGISAALLASLHGLLAWWSYLGGSWRTLAEWPYLRSGAVALGILLLLLLTSFPRSIRALRVRLWKPLHRLTYGAAFFLLLHLLLAPFPRRSLVLLLFGLLAVVQGLRWLPRRRVAP